MPRIIVERSFDPPLTEEDLRLTEARMAPCLNLYRVAGAQLLVGGPAADDLRVRGSRRRKREIGPARGRSQVRPHLVGRGSGGARLRNVRSGMIEGRRLFRRCEFTPAAR